MLCLICSVYRNIVFRPYFSNKSIMLSKSLTKLYGLRLGGGGGGAFLLHREDGFTYEDSII